MGKIKDNRLKNIYQEADGVYRIELSNGFRDDGTRDRLVERVYGTEDDAIKRRDEMKSLQKKKQEKYERKMRLEEIRYMAEYDWNYAIDKAEKIEIKKGKKQGRKLAKIEVALKMKEKDFSRDIIKKVTELPDKTMDMLKIY